MQTRSTAGSQHINQLRICSNSEMRELDRVAEVEFGIGPTLLMENAGRAATQVLLEHYPRAGKESEILVFAGKGNNAGDAFVVARRLMGLERKVRIFHLSTEDAYRGAVAENFKILKKLKAKMMLLETAQDLQSFFDSAPGPFTVIDGIVGTGLKGDLEGIYADIVEKINSLQCGQVLSLDIPSGVNGDTGRVQGAAIVADLTVSFGFPKLGHFLPPGASRRGKLVNVDISLPARFRREGEKFLLLKENLSAFLKSRNNYGHKNSFGHVLLIGGSPGRTGAIAMASSACHRIGAGLVTVATWQSCFETLMGRMGVETMGISLSMAGSELETYRKNLGQYSAIVVGPGLGNTPETAKVLTEVLKNFKGPLLLDADAINVLAEYNLFELLVGRKAPTVLTPHPGEMSRLLGIGKDQIGDDPVNALKKAVEKTHSVVILKGAATLIASPEERVYLNHFPNDGMAKAGSGDVLAGMIGGLLGQGMSATQATHLGVYLHTLAGSYAAKKLGSQSMNASDIVSSISDALQELRTLQETPSVGLEARTHLL